MFQSSIESISMNGDIAECDNDLLKKILGIGVLKCYDCNFDIYPVKCINENCTQLRTIESPIAVECVFDQSSRLLCFLKQFNVRKLQLVNAKFLNFHLENILHEIYSQVMVVEILTSHLTVSNASLPLLEKHRTRELDFFGYSQSLTVKALLATIEKAILGKWPVNWKFGVIRETNTNDGRALSSFLKEMKNQIKWKETSKVEDDERRFVQ